MRYSTRSSKRKTLNQFSMNVDSLRRIDVPTMLL